MNRWFRRVVVNRNGRANHDEIRTGAGNNPTHFEPFLQTEPRLRGKCDFDLARCSKLRTAIYCGSNDEPR
jgi:hypothetical protein